MNEPLESMVTHLVQCKCNGRTNGEKKLALEEPFINLCAEEANGKTSMTWNAILKGLLSRCSQFSRDDLVNIPRPLVSARWRETNDRRVLAPLALKQNADNIIAGNVDMSRKRKSDVDDVWPPTKRIRLDGTMKSCSVVIRRTSAKNLMLQYKCVVNRPFVKLFDILKEIPQEKEYERPVYENEFMGVLGLESRELGNTKQREELRTSNHLTKLVSHTSIPFSSDYGRRLLTRERHCMPQEVALRKLERTEWYLKGAATIPKTNYNPEVTSEKRIRYEHTYRFPKRQFGHDHQSLTQAFIRYVCKPASVALETFDATPYFEKLAKLENNTEILPNVSLDECKDDDSVSVVNSVNVSLDECKDDDSVSVVNSVASTDSEVIVVNNVSSTDSEVIVLDSDCVVVPSENVCEVITENSAPLKLVPNDKSTHCRRSLDHLIKPVQETKNVRRSLRLNNTNPL